MLALGITASAATPITPISPDIAGAILASSSRFRSRPPSGIPDLSIVKDIPCSFFPRFLSQNSLFFTQGISSVVPDFRAQTYVYAGCEGR
jgi:hypothetical protein